MFVVVLNGLFLFERHFFYFVWGLTLFSLETKTNIDLEFFWSEAIKNYCGAILFFIEILLRNPIPEVCTCQPETFMLWNMKIPEIPLIMTSFSVNLKNHIKKKKLLNLIKAYKVQPSKSKSIFELMERSFFYFLNCNLLKLMKWSANHTYRLFNRITLIKFRGNLVSM